MMCEITFLTKYKMTLVLFFTDFFVGVMLEAAGALMLSEKLLQATLFQ